MTGFLGNSFTEFFGKYEGMQAVIMRYYKEKTIVCKPQAKASDNESEKDKNAVETAPQPEIIWIRKFKGSIFVVFKTVENAKVLLDEADLMYKGTSVRFIYLLVFCVLN